MGRLIMVLIGLLFVVSSVLCALGNHSPAAVAVCFTVTALAGGCLVVIGWFLLVDDGTGTKG